jgi:hypothetical protein
VVADKVVKNRLCSRGILDAYRDQDYVTPRVDTERRMVEVPRPAGVVLALTPSTNRSRPCTSRCCWHCSPATPSW